MIASDSKKIIRSRKFGWGSTEDPLSIHLDDILTKFLQWGVFAREIQSRCRQKRGNQMQIVCNPQVRELVGQEGWDACMLVERGSDQKIFCRRKRQLWSIPKNTLLVFFLELHLDDPHAKKIWSALALITCEREANINLHGEISMKMKRAEVRRFLPAQKTLLESTKMFLSCSYWCCTLMFPIWY